MTDDRGIEMDDELLDELEDDPPPMRRTMLTVLGTVLAVAVLAGAVAAVSVAMRSTRTAVNAIDLGASPQVAIKSAGSDVRLVEARDMQLVVRATVTDGLRKTHYELRRSRSGVEVVSECASWLAPGCGVEVTIEVPRGVPVLVATDSADVVADGLRDRVLTVATGSGDVRGRNLEVQELSARTRSGTVNADFSRQPFALKAYTSSGDVRAQLPGGAIDYSVDATSSSGHVTSDLPSAGTGDGLVLVHTASGDVSLRNG
ncbi:DUF4097 family beta strand repeat-containing protein [Aeromicrobium terrae]|uniref:DUF4097 domain-containing protein n=1 Tax=Aeromicrobium terrae TaxID=2498846 RepID=A0A5C8NNB3_9ACTN|nr:DUF4097 family beta strand repeat-containing protein [Aeromicrobium terrae]TXL61943.1 DUF4097 domain-containing protein [Aeromicrobium terrae]